MVTDLSSRLSVAGLLNFKSIPPPPPEPLTTRAEQGQQFTRKADIKRVAKYREILAGKKAMSCAEVTLLMGTSRQAVMKQLNKLAAMGLVIRKGTSHTDLTFKWGAK